MMHRVLRLGRTRHVSDYLRKIVPGVFLQELCSRPGAIGAICPSSPFLARQMARQIDPGSDGLVIELGAGTGAITHALLRRGIAPQRLLVVEHCPAFVARLRKRYPQLNIVHGNAADLGQFVPQGQRVDAIVSSLPLCSLPESLAQAILQQWQHLLHDHGIAVQFTYNLRRPKWRNFTAARQTASRIVWANLPPASVGTYSFKTEKLAAPLHEHATP